MTSSSPPTKLNHWKHRGWVLGGVGIISAVAGVLAATQVTHAIDASDAPGRVFELDIYHVAPGKASALESRFREAEKLQAKHGLNVIGYWRPSGDPAWNDTFIYIVAHSNADEARRNWHAFHTDPEFQKYVEAEKTERLIQSVDQVYMHAAEYSRMK